MNRLSKTMIPLAALFTIAVSGCSYEQAPVYLQTWEVEGHVETGSVSAISYEEADEWQGMQIHLTADEATYADITCEQPVYRVTPVEHDTLRQQYRVDPQDLGAGITGLERLEIECAQSSVNWPSPLVLYIADSNQAFMLNEGVWMSLLSE